MVAGKEVFVQGGNEVGDFRLLTIGPGIDRGVVGERVGEIGHHRDGNLDRRAVGQFVELEHGGSPFSAPTPGPERQILVNEDAQRPSGANGDGGLEVEVLADDLLSGLAGRLLGRLANGAPEIGRSEEPTSELQSLMRISYAVFCLKKTK